MLIEYLLVALCFWLVIFAACEDGRRRVLWTALLLAALFAANASAQPQPQPQPQPSLELRCAVRVTACKGRGCSAGSGVVVACNPEPGKYRTWVVTAAHVVGDSGEATVAWPFITRPEERAAVVECDRENDTALLYLEGQHYAESLPVVDVEPRSAKAIGFGPGRPEAIVADADLVDKSRFTMVSDSGYFPKDYLVFQAPLRSGDSGGPVVSDGVVCGIVSHSSERVTALVPSRAICKVLGRCRPFRREVIKDRRYAHFNRQYSEASTRPADGAIPSQPQPGQQQGGGRVSNGRDQNSVGPPSAPRPVITPPAESPAVAPESPRPQELPAVRPQPQEPPPGRQLAGPPAAPQDGRGSPAQAAGGLLAAVGPYLPSAALAAGLGGPAACAVALAGWFWRQRRPQQQQALSGGGLVRTIQQTLSSNPQVIDRETTHNVLVPVPAQQFEGEAYREAMRRLITSYPGMADPFAQLESVYSQLLAARQAASNIKERV